MPYDLHPLIQPSTSVFILLNLLAALGSNLTIPEGALLVSFSVFDSSQTVAMHPGSHQQILLHHLTPFHSFQPNINAGDIQLSISIPGPQLGCPTLSQCLTGRNLKMSKYTVKSWSFFLRLMYFPDPTLLLSLRNVSPFSQSLRQRASVLSLIFFPLLCTFNFSGSPVCSNLNWS